MTREPVFNVPRGVLVSLIVLVAIHVGRQVLPDDIDTWVVLAAAFIPMRLVDSNFSWPGDPVAGVTSFLTHALIHADAMHLLLNSAWLLAFGGAVAMRIGNLRYFAFTLACATAGATAFLIAHWGEASTVIGASGVVSGMMGGLLRFLFNALDRGGLQDLRRDPGSVPIMSLATAIGDRRVVAAIAIWLLVNALTSLGLGAPSGAGPIAWEAHAGGFVMGFLTFGFFTRRGPAISQSRY